MDIKYERRTLLFRIIILALMISLALFVVCSCKKNKNGKNQSAPSVESVRVSTGESVLDSLSVSEKESEFISEESIESLSESCFASETVVDSESIVESATEIASEHSSESEFETYSEESQESVSFSEYESWSFAESESDFEQESQIEESEDESEVASEVESEQESQEEPIFYTITFIIDDNIIEEQLVKATECVQKPQDPQKEKYEFLGWFYNDAEYDFLIPVSSDITLEARWDKVVFDVVFQIENNCDEPQSVNKGEFIKEPQNLYKQGYEFIGWFLNGEKFNFNCAINEDIVLVARFEVLKPIDNFVGTWEGEGSENNHVFNITSSDSGTYVQENFFYSITYEIIQVIYCQDVLKITYEYEETVVSILFRVVEDKLVFIDDFTKEEIVCLKVS